MHRHIFRIVPFLAIFAAASSLPAQVTQHRGETYDQFNTRRIQEETANHRNNNPTFSGPRPSDNADWSAWNGLIERYNARHATLPAGPSAPRVVSAEERAAAEARASDARATQYQRELENRDQGILNRYAELRKKGDLSATLRVGQIFDRGAVPAQNTYNGTKSEMAFRLYHEARSLQSPEQKACYLGIIPRLLGRAQESTPGNYLGYFKGEKERRQRDGMTDNEKFVIEQSMISMRKGGEWNKDLLLALWYQHGDIGLGSLQTFTAFYDSLASDRRAYLPKPIAPGDRQAECLRLLKNVQAAHPSLGNYFIGAMTVTYGTSNPLYLETLKKLAGPVVPLAGDKDNTYALVFQEEARLLLANLHLKKKVPNPSDEIALLLLRGCHGFSWPDARLAAGDLIYRGQLETPHPFQEAVDDYESVFRDDPDANYPLHKYRAAISRGLIKLTGETASERLRLPPDLAAAQAEFERAQAVKVIDGADEARCRALFVQAIGSDATLAAKAAQTLAADKRELWLVSTGLLHARGQGGLPRDPKKAQEHFQQALDLKSGANTRIRGPDAVAVVEALRELQKEQLLPTGPGPAYETFLDRALRHNPTIYVPSLASVEQRLAQGEPNQPLAVTYRRAIKDLERLAGMDGGGALQPATMIRRAIADLEIPLEPELSLCLSAVVSPEDKKPWQEAFAAKGPARVAALAGIKQPTATPLIAALQAREKFISGDTFAAAQSGLAELCAFAEKGSLDALRLLARKDTAWRSHEAPLYGQKPNTAPLWSEFFVKRTKAAALARFEGNFPNDSLGFHRMDAQAHWNTAHFYGEPAVESQLARLHQSIPPEHRKTLNSSIYTVAEWAQFAPVEVALTTLNDEWWFLPHVERFKAACHAFYSISGQRPLIEPYLSRELKGLTDSDHTEFGNYHLLRAIYAARGVIAAAKSEDAQKHLDEALNKQKAGGKLDPALLEEARTEIRRVKESEK